ncbi:recombinase family protein [Falsihalocynthiibacter sp. BN13B15]|uniref:recombinase family protein n=1 Tax=Falsihalocynthiibacter sp. BN13B15 TaxID=3240871 RepID=UPI003510BAA7
MQKIRCAIYTRKSSEEGLEQDFNSLDAQREACEAYVTSQKHEGWVALVDHYDDGGISGGTLERPSLKRLMQDIDDGLVDQIVVYKIDRLTRSLGDFARLVDRLDAANASFVSVTQSFNTATSMGRLTLNVLLSFAQFEREVTAERIRDKIAASKRKGMWMGGMVPLGYNAAGRTLEINGEEAETIRTLFELYHNYGTVREVAHQAAKLGLRSKKRTNAKGVQSGGIALDRGHIHHILTNPIHAGRIRHRDKTYEGLHEAIIEPAVWDDVQTRLQVKAAYRRGEGKKVKDPSPLIGKLFDETGDRFTPSHSRKQGKRHRYYVSHRLVKRAGEKDLSGWRLPALQLEQQITKTIQEHLVTAATPEMVDGLTSEEIVRIRAQVELAGLKQKKLFALIRRIDIAAGSMQIRLDTDAMIAVLQIEPDRLIPEALTITQPFRIRKRGVETKLIIGDNPAELDDALIRNIAKAHHWFAMIKSGKTFDEIAATEATSKRRIQQVIEWALLAPDIVRMIVEGRQPIGLTSNWLLRHALPTDWNAQRQLIATL